MCRPRRLLLPSLVFVALVVVIVICTFRLVPSGKALGSGSSLPEVPLGNATLSQSHNGDSCEEASAIVDRIIDVFHFSLESYTAPTVPLEAESIKAEIGHFSDILAAEEESPTKWESSFSDDSVVRDGFTIVNRGGGNRLIQNPKTKSTIEYQADCLTFHGKNSEREIFFYSDKYRKAYVVMRGNTIRISVCQDDKAVCSCVCVYAWMPGPWEPGYETIVRQHSAKYILDGVVPRY